MGVILFQLYLKINELDKNIVYDRTLWFRWIKILYGSISKLNRKLFMLVGWI